MSGVSEAWLRWRLSEEGDEAREWATQVVENTDQPIPEQAGRRLHGLSAAVALGPGRQDTSSRLSSVCEFLTGQQARAAKRKRTDEVRFWQEVQEKLKELDETARRILNRLADEVLTGEESESPEELHLTLVELYINTLLACWQAKGEHQ
jgi:hypothetical protein